MKGHHREAFEPKNGWYFKHFGDGPVIRMTGSVLFSGCICHGLELTFATFLADSMIDFRNIYCVCPQYRNSKGFSDVQATVTGTCVVDELAGAAANRECQEEVGVCKNCKYYGQYKTSEKTLSNFSCWIDKNTEMCISTKENQPYQDDKTSKVQILVCGYLDDLLQKYSQKIIPPTASDNIPSKNTYICGICLISLEDIMTLHNKKFSSSHKIRNYVSQIQNYQEMVRENILNK